MELCLDICLRIGNNRVCVNPRSTLPAEDAMSFGRNLQRLRQQAGLSQAGLAEKANIPIKTIQNWEIDRNQPRLEALMKLAQALAAPLDELTASVKRAAKGRRSRPPSTKKGKAARRRLSSH